MAEEKLFYERVANELDLDSYKLYREALGYDLTQQQIEVFIFDKNLTFEKKKEIIWLFGRECLSIEHAIFVKEILKKIPDWAYYNLRFEIIRMLRQDTDFDEVMDYISLQVDIQKTIKIQLSESGNSDIEVSGIYRALINKYNISRKE